MNLYIINNSFRYELENVTRLFFPNEKINVCEACDSFVKPYIIAESGERLSLKVEINDFSREQYADKTDTQEDERLLCELLYKALCDYSGVTPPWGMLTGVRPIKFYRQLKNDGGESFADNSFLEKYFVSPEKLSIAKRTEVVEKRVIDLSSSNSFSLYIGIPFCPSRCRYCSFVQSSVERSGHLIEPYTKLLCDEIKATAKIASDLGLKLETVYMGGGTPTTLSPGQLKAVLSAVNDSFDTSSLREFTVEAGRPDPVDRDKLISIKENRVDRISINPQTLIDPVLENIGRKHNTAQFFGAYRLAREIGFKSINADLIAGLPGDSFEGFCYSLDNVIKLCPECITVHTLSMKRSSSLTQDGTPIERKNAEEAAKMLEYSNLRLSETGYIPYYLYRQTRMVGNLENTGWAKPAHESLYNIYVMDETHTILGVGAGAVTKLKSPRTGYLKRIFNYKYPYEYIGRFADLLDRKNEIYTFYKKYVF